MKLTPWFSAETEPYHIGWYEVHGIFAETPTDEPGIVRRHWNGYRWYWKDGAGNMSIATVFPFETWRGLAEEPK